MNARTASCFGKKQTKTGDCKQWACSAWTKKKRDKTDTPIGTHTWSYILKRPMSMSWTLNTCVCVCGVSVRSLSWASLSMCAWHSTSCLTLTHWSTWKPLPLHQSETECKKICTSACFTLHEHETNYYHKPNNNKKKMKTEWKLHKKCDRHLHFSTENERRFSGYWLDIRHDTESMGKHGRSVFFLHLSCFSHCLMGGCMWMLLCNNS